MPAATRIDPGFGFAAGLIPPPPAPPVPSHAAFDVETIRPFGCIVHARREGTDLRTVPVEQLRELVLEHRLAVLRGFPLFTREALEEYCAAWGRVLTWNFGKVLDLIVHEQPKNYLFTNGSVPYHFDGAFAEVVPGFQLFQCLKAPLPGTGGETTFADTTRIWEDASPARRASWANIAVTYATEKLAHYGGRITVPLKGAHPTTGVSTLRYNEPPDEHTADLNTPKLEFPGLPPERSEGLIDEMRRLLYDPRYCYEHAWTQGEILIADNHALLHDRRPYASHSPRHLQRVHIV